MPSPLPGMDPYLEHPQSWPNFHHRLITAIAIDLAPQLRLGLADDQWLEEWLHQRGMR